MQFQEEQDYTKRFDAGIWVHLLKYAKPFYKHLSVVAAMMLVCAGMDVVFPRSRAKPSTCTSPTGKRRDWAGSF